MIEHPQTEITLCLQVWWYITTSRPSFASTIKLTGLLLWTARLYFIYEWMYYWQVIYVFLQKPNNALLIVSIQVTVRNVHVLHKYWSFFFMIPDYCVLQQIFNCDLFYSIYVTFMITVRRLYLQVHSLTTGLAAQTGWLHPSNHRARL